MSLKQFILKRLLGHERFGRRVGVKIGTDCRILSSNFGTEPFLIEIGNRVTVSSNVTFLTHDGASWLVRDEKGRRYIYRPLKIGSECFIGANSTLMPGVEIGDKVIVGAGAMVTKSVPSGSIVAGVPARIIGSYEDFHRRTLAMPSEADIAHIVDFRGRVMKALNKKYRSILSK
ncbi:hypothetical protein SxD43FB_22890 [Sphingobium sp. D43FB]|nr:hypothetical protein SxD43FB_22890 [Sphingobium sp. D43FB]